MSGHKPNQTSFAPGASGNPGGRPKTGDISALARRYTVNALRALVEVADMPLSTRSANAKVAAARALTDLGYPATPRALRRRSRP
jgi:hypothetical protein